ncbi:cytochrome c [Mameliella alba]|nr:cytochrome c [Mameliella alba]MBY6171199.1 cytochrome c [Mameliella alba]MBY6176423.1 cytochrome c [Mameliella alba]
MRKTVLTGLLVVAGAAALAHSGVQNAAVLARMDNMKTIGDTMKLLGSMAKGQTDFQPEVAQAAALQIAKHAGQTPALFEAPETDPKSEAKPAIWENFDDFSAKSLALETAALEVAQALSSKDALVPSVQRLGETCKSCHSLYRE